MAYASDRAFTDFIHSQLALKIIYPKMDWVVQDLNNRMGQNIDINNAVDYIAVDKNRRMVTIQERFREMKYASYSDFTVRYMRPENPHEERRMSEFFKLDAMYFIYGTIDVSKADYQKASRFLKYAVLNLDNLKKRIDDGTILIDPKLPGYTCSLQGNTMRCPVNENKDHSSNFVPFDIKLLNRVAPEIVEYQEGFI